MCVCVRGGRGAVDLLTFDPYLSCVPWGRLQSDRGRGIRRKLRKSETQCLKQPDNTLKCNHTCIITRNLNMYCSNNLHNHFKNFWSAPKTLVLLCFKKPFVFSIMIGLELTFLDQSTNLSIDIAKTNQTFEHSTITQGYHTKL